MHVFPGLLSGDPPTLEGFGGVWHATGGGFLCGVLVRGSLLCWSGFYVVFDCCFVDISRMAIAGEREEKIAYLDVTGVGCFFMLITLEFSCAVR